MTDGIAEAPIQRQAYSVAEVAQILGVSRDKVYELVRAGVIPHKPIGRRYLIPCKSLHDWLNSPET